MNYDNSVIIITRKCRNLYIMTVIIFVLTLDEIDGVSQIMPKIKKEWADQIMLVDGGSTDGTIKEAEKLGLEIIHQKNKGPGGAILTGVQATN